ncbi:Glycerol 2-dehydrogenase-like protein [Emericellopsis cladophorae]|uniref:Glycerol 2-dehydrogenase-like protein n=1 Tax=Emericellopsis cladophorae TaxID=2686198 RepID=A0A9P9Y1W0_9HYPO|nr:Glycerol 2-dehydrogenase-like protein [Emericellopsis cladophorae]KAI6781628.1 Glycerol 2-dehydrogenase-like protein [Emericellopsis cladophorae]
MVCTTTFQLNTGHQFPAVGLGTWQGKGTIDDENALESSIIHALQSGYRLVDTAQLYGTEHVVGRAIRNSGVPRSEITVVTKFWGHWHHDPAAALRISLEELDIEYIDVFLMHWPWATAPDRKPLRKDESPTFKETWTMMESLVGDKCRAIGVSNFTQKTLDELAETAKVTPAINQVELHALNPNHKLVEYCHEKGIVVMSWATLGGGGDSDTKEVILGHELFKTIAQAHGCSTGVVSLSWAVQRGINVIPKSGSHDRIEENISLVTLTDEEMDKINNAHKTIKSYRLAKGIQGLRMKVDGKDSLQMWTWQDFGWEDESGNWLT